MAAIDKIYGTPEQYDEFRAWVEKKCKRYLRHFYERPIASVGPITNLTSRADEWIYFRCPINWVRKAIEQQYAMDYWRKQYSQSAKDSQP